MSSEERRHPGKSNQPPTFLDGFRIQKALHHVLKLVVDFQGTASNYQGSFRGSVLFFLTGIFQGSVAMHDS